MFKSQKVVKIGFSQNQNSLRVIPKKYNSEKKYIIRNCSFRAIFRPKNILYAPGKLCSETPDVFFCFSCIFGCELTVFSVNLDAEPWNLEFFWWTKNEVRVNQKNSRFQGEASRWTEKTVREQPKIKEKQEKTKVSQCIVLLKHTK